MTNPLSNVSTQQNNPQGANARTSVWKNAPFLVLLGAGAIMALGNKIYELALPLILYQLTQSPVMMSTLRAIEFLPNLLLAMFIGVIVDRVHKKRFSLIAIAIQVVVLALLYGSLESGHSPAYLFYVSAFVLMTFGYAYNNARVALVKYSLAQDMLTSANASYNFVTTLIGIAGPAMTGLLLMLPNMNTSLLITAIAFGLSFLILLAIPSAEQQKTTTAPRRFWAEFREGWVELLSNRPLLMMTVVVVFLNSASGMVDTTLIFFAKDELHLTNAQLGVVLAAAGIGGLIGSLLIGKLRMHFTVGRLVTLSCLCVGLTNILFFVTHSMAMLAVGLLLYGLFETISTVCIWTFRQETTPHRLIGRVSGITGSLFKLGMPFAIIGSGWVSELWNPRVVFLIALLLNALLFLGCLASPLWKSKQTNG